MIRSTFVAVAFGVTVCAASVPAAAQGIASRSVHFGLMGGAAIPTHYLADYYSGYDAGVGGGAGAFFAIAVPRTPFSIRFDGQWQQLPAASDLATHYRIIDGTADLVYAFASARRTSFYALGGGGIYNERIRQDDPGYNASATHFGVNGGLGVNFRLGSFATFIESRYHYVVRGSRIGASSCAHLSVGIAQSCPSDTRPSLQFIPISAGFAF